MIVTLQSLNGARLIHIAQRHSLSRNIAAVEATEKASE
jgi:hypothetical protein